MINNDSIDKQMKTDISQHMAASFANNSKKIKQEEE
jgi:hypothetical protein